MSSTKPVANPGDAFLQSNDGVAISFWSISIAMTAVAVFFFADRSNRGVALEDHLAHGRPCHIEGHIKAFEGAIGLSAT